MLTTALVSVLAVLGTSALAAPLEPTHPFNPDPELIPANSTMLDRRFTPKEPPSPSNIKLWYWLDGKLVGEIGEKYEAKNVFEDCRVEEWGHKHDRGLGPAWDALVKCHISTTQLVYDIRRLGERPTRCDLGATTETWNIEKSETKKTGVNLSVGGAFDFFSGSFGVDVSDEKSLAESFTKEVSCGSDFKGTRCAVGGRALTRIRWAEGWVNVPDGDYEDLPNGQRKVKNWLGSENKPWGPDYFKTYSQYAFNNRYASGWVSWEDQGDQRCSGDFDNAHYQAESVGK